jgi:hypothetical protein
MGKSGDIRPVPAHEQSASVSTPSEIDGFLSRLRSGPAPASSQGRLIFALDATMSRQPTWDAACRLQAEMFEETGRVGGLSIQLVYYRGFSECRASRWVSDSRALRDLMTAIECRGGHTQIRKVLSHARREAGKGRVQGLVFVGDAVEEPVDDLCARAGELGLLSLPVFLFHEGHNPHAEGAFREIARLTRGAYVRFDRNAPGQLASLLRAVALYAVGGRKALTAGGGAGARLLLEQLR